MWFTVLCGNSAPPFCSECDTIFEVCVVEFQILTGKKNSGAYRISSVCVHILKWGLQGYDVKKKRKVIDRYECEQAGVLLIIVNKIEAIAMQFTQI